MKNISIKAITAFTIIASILTIVSLKEVGQSQIKITQQDANKESEQKITQQEFNDQSVLAINWFQQSGEYVALAHQAFNISKILFEQARAKGVKNPAVIVDIDETVLDNSAYQASLVDTDNSFPTNWDNWIKAKKATAIPGAVEFINYVNSNGGKVFFISDRSKSSTNNPKNTDLELATIANLKRVGFQGIDEKTVLLKGELSKVINGKENLSKQWRREAVENGLADGKKHQIVVLVGDNLNDFDEQAGSLNNDRKHHVESLKKNYGISRTNYSKTNIKPAYIVLPNPMYGAWESGLYKPSDFGKEKWNQLTPSEKNQQRKNNLIKWVND